MKSTRRDFFKIISSTLLAIIVEGFLGKLYAFSNGFEPNQAPVVPNLSNRQDNQINMCWIGHSTYLINFFGVIILTDPVFSERIGPYALISNLGPMRIVKPAIPPEKVPQPDLIIISHAHFDHLDYPTLKYFAKKFPNKINVVTAFKTKDIFDDLPFKEIIELDWNETFEIDDLIVKALENKHYGWRYPWEKDRSKGFKDGRSYNSYILEKNNRKILFSGDTSYTDLYSSYRNENIDIALMPIGAYNPWQTIHCNPEEALQMANNLNAKYFIPMHTKTFSQGLEPYHEAIEWLKKSEKNYNLKVGLYEIGETFSLS